MERKHREVALIIFYSDDRILVQDRRDMSVFGEEWGFFGGHIEFGETPEQAVIRETLEELEFVLKEFEPIGSSHHSMEGHTVTVHTFAAPCPELSTFVQHEGQGMRLVNQEEAAKLKFNKSDSEILDLVFGFVLSKRTSR